MAEAPKGYQRKDSYDTVNADTRQKGPNQDKIKAELERISQKGHITPNDILELSEKYKDDDSVVEEVLRLYSKRHDKVKKRAREVAQKIYRKYQNGDRPLHEILNKMLKYKKDNNWTDAEYEEFRRELSHLLSGSRPNEITSTGSFALLNSRINRALGVQVPERTGLRVKQAEQPVVNEIISNYERNKPLHQSVIMQSLTYEDCAIQAISGEYKSDRHVASNHIHPLLAVMFLPKINIFEVHMLYASIANIVKTRALKQPITNEPDYLLYNDLIADPNDVVCDVDSPFSDLRNRARVQSRLWEIVLRLREGNYYNVDSIGEFFNSLDVCRNNLYDNADLAYNRDEGSMMRRLLSVFSLRPTTISTQPLQGLSGMGASFGMGPGFGMGSGFGMGFGMAGGNFPFNAQPIQVITNISMITYNIQDGANGMATGSDLRSALNQTIWITEDKTIVPKQQNIITSREVLIFYVNRRVPRAQVKSYTSPMQFSQLPLAMNTFEKLNSTPVYIPDRLTLTSSNDTYLLRSVVAVKELAIKQGNNVNEIISGTVGLIMKHRNIDSSDFDTRFLLYDPYGASVPVRTPDGTGYVTNKPISYIDEFSFDQSDADKKNVTFMERASRNGTVFIYAKGAGYNNNGLY